MPDTRPAHRVGASGFEVARPSAPFPRGATFDIVCLRNHADLKEWGSDNVKNGTSAARGPTRPGCPNIQVRGSVGGNSKFKTEH